MKPAAEALSKEAENAARNLDKNCGTGQSIIRKAYAADAPTAVPPGGFGCAVSQVLSPKLHQFASWMGTRGHLMPIRELAVLAIIPPLHVSFPNIDWTAGLHAMTSVIDPITMTTVADFVVNNDHLVARMITGVFLVSDLLHLPGDILNSFLWRSMTHMTLFSETTLVQLEGKGYTLARAGDMVVVTLQGKKEIPVFEATTKQGKVFRFVPVRRLWNVLDQWRGVDLPPDLVIAPVTDAVISPLTPVGHLLLRAATSKTMAFLIINGIAQAAGNALGGQISPWFVAPAAVAQSVVSNVISTVIQTPIRMGYVAYRMGRFVLSTIQGKLTANSLTITQAREVITDVLNAIQNVFKKGQAVVEKANDDGCFSYNPFIFRVYAAGEGSGSTCPPAFMSRNAFTRELRDNAGFRENILQSVTKRFGIQFAVSGKKVGPGGCKFPKCIRVDRMMVYIAMYQLLSGDFNTRWIAVLGKSLVDDYVSDACKPSVYFAFHNIEEGRVNVAVAKEVIAALMQKDPRDRDAACERLIKDGIDDSAYTFPVDDIQWDIRTVNGNIEYYTSDPRIIEYLRLSVDGKILPAMILQPIDNGAIAKISDWDSIVAAYKMLGKDMSDPVYIQFLAQDIPDAQLYKFNGISQADFQTAISDPVVTPWFVSNNGQLDYLNTPNEHIGDNDTAIRILWPFNYNDSLLDYSYKGNSNLIGAVRDLAVGDPTAMEYYGTYMGMMGENKDGVPVNIIVAPGMIWSSNLQGNLQEQLKAQGIDGQVGIMDPIIYNAVNTYWGLDAYETEPNVMDKEIWSKFIDVVVNDSADPNAVNSYVLIH